LGGGKGKKKGKRKRRECEKILNKEERSKGM
jgi:hypothetical protein